MATMKDIAKLAGFLHPLSAMLLIKPALSVKKYHCE